MSEPRYSWVVRNGDDEPCRLLPYRWTSLREATFDAEHWHHHYTQVKTVEVTDEGWREAE